MRSVIVVSWLQEKYAIVVGEVRYWRELQAAVPESFEQKMGR